MQYKPAKLDTYLQKKNMHYEMKMKDSWNFLKNNFQIKS